MNWVTILTYVGVMILMAMFIALFYFLLYLATKKSLERRYNPKNDKGRRSEDYRGSNRPSVGGTVSERKPSVNQSDEPSRPKLLPSFPNWEHGEVIDHIRESIDRNFEESKRERGRDKQDSEISWPSFE